MANSVFNNIKVLDFSGWVAGPLITKTLADYGATVVLVESAKRVQQQRGGQPYKDNKPGVNRSFTFAYHNPNKYSVSIDLSHPQGVDVAKRLVAWADIVVENFTPGVMEKWGLGYDGLKKIKPDIIMLRTSAEGQTGPLRTIKALGLHVQALSGFTHFTGLPEQEPLSYSFAFPDYIIPFVGLAALCSALDYRKRTGKGQMLDISQYEASLQFIAPYLVETSVNGQVSGRMGNSHQYAAPHGCYPCKGDDYWCSIAVFTDEEWCSFCKAIGNPPWVTKPEFTTFVSRKKNEKELDKLVGEWTINHTAEEVMAIMQKAGISSGIAKKGSDIYSDPQLNERDFFWKLQHKEIGEVTHLGQPSILSKTPAKPRLPAPCVGEHTEFVCREFLHMSETEFAELLISDAFGLLQPS